MGESGDVCPAERTHLTGEKIIGFAIKCSALKNNCLLILYGFNKKFATLPVYFCGTSVHCA